MAIDARTGLSRYGLGLRPGDDAVLKGVLRDHFGISSADLSTKVFPDPIGVLPMDGLVG